MVSEFQYNVNIMIAKLIFKKRLNYHVLVKIAMCIIFIFIKVQINIVHTIVQWRTKGEVWGVQIPPPKFRRPSKMVQNSTLL